MSKSSAAARVGHTSRSTRNTAGTAGRNRRFGPRRGHLAAVEMFTRPERSMPLLIALCLWRWRWELLWLSAGIAGYLYARHAELSTAEWILAAEVPIALVAFPVTRHFLRNRVWCVITRHRIRVCLAEMRAMNHSGRLPFVLSARSTPVGERLWLILRPGLSVDDIAGHTETLAASCWAAETRVTRAKKHATFVRVDVIRRDSLGKEIVPNPLTQLRTGGFIASAREFTNLYTNDGFSPFRAGSADPDGLFADDTDPRPETGRPADPKPRKRPYGQRPSQPGTPPVLGHNGEDLSDYV